MKLDENTVVVALRQLLKEEMTDDYSIYFNEGVIAAIEKVKNLYAKK